MVSSERDDLARSVPVELLADTVGSEDGVVVVTTERTPAATVRRLTDAVDALVRGRLAVVDRTGGDAPDDVTVRSLQGGADPDALSVAVEDCFAALDSAGADRVHLLVDAIDGSPDDEAVDRVYDRTHDIAMTVGAEPGAALFAVDASGFSSGFVDQLTHLFDVHVRLRESDAGREARWTSLTGSSDGWRSWSEVEFCRSRPV